MATFIKWFLLIGVLVVSSLGHLTPGATAVVWSLAIVCYLVNFAVNVLVDRIYTEQRSLYGGRDVLVGVTKVDIGHLRR